MHANRVALVVLVIAGLIATGCGSDDDAEPSSGGQGEATQVEKAEPKRKSVRARMTECIENELGFDVAPDGGPDSLSVKSADGERKAVIVIHNDAAAARKAVDETLSAGTNAVVFGRAEFIRHEADDTEAGVIVNCVALAYNRPG